MLHCELFTIALLIFLRIEKSNKWQRYQSFSLKGGNNFKLISLRTTIFIGFFHLAIKKNIKVLMCINYTFYIFFFYSNLLDTYLLKTNFNLHILQYRVIAGTKY